MAKKMAQLVVATGNYSKRHIYFCIQRTPTLRFLWLWALNVLKFLSFTIIFDQVLLMLYQHS